MPDPQNPYPLWSTRRSLGLMRAQDPEFFYFDQFYLPQHTILSNEEWVDFEKLPALERRLAPFVLPLARGHGVWTDGQRSYRFKPAYSIVEESIDPLAPLSFHPGLGESVFDVMNDPMKRLELLRAAKLQAASAATRRRWHWMRAQSIINAGYIVKGPAYPETPISFGRNADHTIVLGSGQRFGDAGVSIVSFFQMVVDRMNDAEFGGVPTRATMGGSVAKVLRDDPEFLKHMDMFLKGGTITVERGVVAGKVYKFGEMLIGGASGATIELWVNDETYTNDARQKVRYLGANQIVFTAAPETIMGYSAFGRIVDRDAQYQALPEFPKFFFTGDDVKTENLTIKSAPLMVPINPNATLLATVLA